MYKLNPAGVKKTHLTPCRRVGLSRISKTPNTPASDTIKIHSDSIPVNKVKAAASTKCSPQPDNLESSLSEALKSEPVTKSPLLNSTNETSNFTKSSKPETTKTSIGNGTIKAQVTPCRRVGLTRKSRNPDTPASNSNKLSSVSDFNTPVNRIEAVTDTKCTPQLDNMASLQNNSVKNEPVAKRNLNNRFNVESHLCSTLSKSTDEVNNLSTLDDSKIEDHNPSSCIKDESNENQEDLRESCKRQNPNDSDTREDGIKKVFIKQLSNYIVSIPKISEEVIDCYQTKFIMDLSETFALTEKKASSNYDSDDDFQCTPQWERKLSRQTSSQTSSPIIPTKRKLKAKCPLKFLSSSSSINEDENAFTSSPDTELHEKKELLNKIADLESQIKTKSQKLETLRRASVYKSKHNIEELKALTNVWKKGCCSALNDLLLKLQSHAPIEMPKLLQNLHIPHDIAAKIFEDNSD